MRRRVLIAGQPADTRAPPSLTFRAGTQQVDAILVIRRKDNDKLACVGGFVEVGETLEHAVRREVMEETGLTVSSLRMIPQVTSRPTPWASSRGLVSACYAMLVPGGHLVRGGSIFAFSLVRKS